MSYQGGLMNPSTGEPVTDGPCDATLELWVTELGGVTPVWSEKLTIVVSRGLFSVPLGAEVKNPIEWQGKEPT